MLPLIWKVVAAVAPLPRWQRYTLLFITLFLSSVLGGFLTYLAVRRLP